MRQGRELRVFANTEEMVADFHEYPKFKADVPVAHGNRLLLRNMDNKYEVHWLNIQEHDIIQDVSGIEYSSLFITHNVDAEVARWCFTRVRWPYDTSGRRV